MLHLIHPALPRAAALTPHRLRQQALAGAAVAVGLALIVSNGLNGTLASAAPWAGVGNERQVIPSAVSVPDVRRALYTVDLRPSLIYPVGVNTVMGSDFGPRAQACDACSTNHAGVDWNPARGTPIHAMADGVVSTIGPAGSTLGVWIAIDHVVNGQAITSVYGHMEQGSLPFQLGDRVRSGDVVGTVGSTGVTTAPHLHFELRIDGTPIDPVAWLESNGAQ